MAQGEVYGAFEFSPKGYTRGSDVGKGQIGLPHLTPAFFLELKLVKIHTHTGVDSQKLRAEATPEMVRGYKISEREERGVATWSGASAANGSVVLTFGTAFQEAPSVLVTAADASGNIVVGIGSKSATGVTIYWKDHTAANHTTLDLEYLIKGR